MVLQHIPSSTQPLKLNSNGLHEVVPKKEESTMVQKQQTLRRPCTSIMNSVSTTKKHHLNTRQQMAR